MLPDILKPGLTVVFVGTAKSAASARAGHYYANPNNMFWNLLEATGLAGDAWIGSANDQLVLEHGVGLTDLVAGRAASSDSLLRPGDFDVDGFLKKMKKMTPSVIAFNGAKAADKVASALGQPKTEEGPAPWKIGASRAYRLPSSSSANAAGGYAAKRAKWAAFGRWVRGLAVDEAPAGRR